ncbi:MAG: hypothetical protein AAGC68_17980, partial [Verrucomicrobiota bacterium]
MKKVTQFFFPHFLVALVFPAVSYAQVTDPVVMNNNDNGSGSLRQAIADATNGSRITFDPGVSGDTIVLTSGSLSINKDLTIDGSTLREAVTISGDADESGTPTANDSRVFTIHGGIVFFDTLMVTGGYPNSPGGGGGIVVLGGNLTIDSTTVYDNQSSTGGYDGGGIWHSAPLTVVNSTISGNVASSSTGNSTDPIHGG